MFFFLIKKETIPHTRDKPSPSLPHRQHGIAPGQASRAAPQV